MQFISLGADPEFGFLEDGEFVNADQYYDGGEGIFGHDGCSSIAELRPLPAYSVDEFVKNVRLALQTGYVQNKSTRNLTWKAGSMVGGQPIGGHIHIGGLGKGIRTNLTKALDCLVAPVGALLENRAEGIRRKAGSYGHLSNMREQNWGWEYRTLASWLTSPKVAKGLLSMCYVISALIENKDFLSDLEKTETMKADEFKKHDTEIYYGCLESNWPMFDAHMKTKKFSRLRKNILSLLRMIPNGWGHNNDIKETWNLKKGLVNV